MARDRRLTELRETGDRLEFHGPGLAQGTIRAYAEAVQVVFGPAARCVPEGQTAVMVAENDAQFLRGLDRALTTIRSVVGDRVMELFRTRSIVIEIQAEILRASSPAAGGRRDEFLEIIESLLLNSDGGGEQGDGDAEPRAEETPDGLEPMGGEESADAD